MYCDVFHILGVWLPSLAACTVMYLISREFGCHLFFKYININMINGDSQLCIVYLILTVL